MRFFLFATHNLHLHKDPVRVPADISSSHPICIKCRYYIPPNDVQNLKKGYCALSGMMHLVDGTIKYERAEEYRPYVCKGQYYEDAPIALTPMDSSDEVLYTE